VKNQEFLKIPSIWERILRLVYPVKCMICDEVLKEDTALYLCETCSKMLPYYRKGFCAIPRIPYINGLFAAFYYENGVDRAIQAMKFNHQPLLSRTMAWLLYREMVKEKFLPDFDIVIPVPMHRRKKHKRGYNQAELVAIKLADYLEVPVHIDNLVKIRKTRPQSSLKREGRLHNIEGSFQVKDPALVSGKSILLVDDVVTTGTTLNTCAKILYENGASWIFASAIAIAEK
jgi:ComF family protein